MTTGSAVVGYMTVVGLLLVGLCGAAKRGDEKLEQRDAERRGEQKARAIVEAYRGAYIEPVKRKPQGICVYGDDESEIAARLLESIQ